MIPEKECSRCGEVKAIYHFVRGGKNSLSSGVDGYRTYCRACKNKADEIGRKARAEKEAISRNSFGPRQTSVFAITRPYDHTSRAICPRCSSFMSHNMDGDFSCISCGNIEYAVETAKAETT